MWVPRGSVRRWWWAVGILLAAGCQSTTGVGDRYFESGRYLEAAAAFQAYLETHPHDSERVARSLFRLGVIYATPETSVYAPNRAIEVLDRLLTEKPGSSYTPAARLIRDLQVEVMTLEQDLANDRDRLVRLVADLEQREAELDEISRTVGERDEAIAKLEKAIPPLWQEVQQLTRQLDLKRQELDRLKAIDLEQPP